MKFQIHGTTLVDQEDTSDADDNDVLSVAFDDDDLPATENQQRKDVSDIGFTPSMTTLTLPRTTNQRIGTMRHYSNYHI